MLPLRRSFKRQRGHSPRIASGRFIAEEVTQTAAHPDKPHAGAGVLGAAMGWKARQAAWQPGPKSKLWIWVWLRKKKRCLIGQRPLHRIPPCQNRPIRHSQNRQDWTAEAMRPALVRAPGPRKKIGPPSLNLGPGVPTPRPSPPLSWT